MNSQLRRVVCTGIGSVNPLGLNARESWSALLNSKSGISELRREHSFEGCQSRVAGYIDGSRLEDSLKEQKNSYLVRNSKQLSKATIYAMLATQEALEDAKVLDESNSQIQDRLQQRSGVAIGQGMVDFEDIYHNGKLFEPGDAGFRRMSPFFMTRALMNMSAGSVSIRYKLQGPSHCASTACATGLHSIGDAFEIIRRNKADMMICGSTEASVNYIAMAGFERLRALCTKFNDFPEKASRPFDSKRAGFVMGEGAGIIILEELEHARSRGIKCQDMYCELLGYGLASDAHHLTAPLPDGGGARRCMMAALEDSGLEASQIGHLNAHATSTPLGDDIECNAIEEIFYKNNPNNDLTITSCKGSIGHLLGAAGSVEMIFAILSCKNSLQPQLLNLDEPLKTKGNLVKFVREKPIQWKADKRYLMKNSFGFGGTNGSLIISNFAD